MSETKTFDATIIRAGAYRTLRQPIRYENGRAVAYRCPDCHELHPLTPRDWDESRGVYAGRDCGTAPRIVAVRAANNAYNRAYYATHPEFRDRKNRRAREAWRAGRAEAARRAAQGGTEGGR